MGQLTYCQGLYVEVLATSGSAAYLLGGSTIHRFFRLDIEMKSRLELGTIDCSAVANTDVIIVDECSMISAKLFETMHDLCCYATTDAAKRQLVLATTPQTTLAIWPDVSVGLVTKGVSTVSSRITVPFCAPRTSTRTGSIWACSTLFPEIVSL